MAAHNRPGSNDPGLVLSDQVDPIWQMRFGETVEAGMTPVELNQWESNTLSAAVPAVAVDGSRLFANYLSYLFALDLKTGKMLWCSEAFHHLEVPAMQDAARFTDATRYAIIASGEHVWSLSRDLKDGNFQAPFHLVCRRAENGEVIWQSNDLSDYAGLDLNGPPILAAGRIFIPAKGQGDPRQGQGGMSQVVLSIQPHDGKVVWKGEVGMLRQDNRFNWYGYNREPDAQPRLVYRTGSIYVETHQGVFARLDADSANSRLGVRLSRPTPFRARAAFFWGYNQPSEPAPSGSLPAEYGETFLLKGMQSAHLYAIDPNRMKVLWDRPISKTSRLLARQRPHRLSWWCRIERTRSGESKPAMGNSRAGRLHECPGAAAARGNLAIDAARLGRARSQIGLGAAILPRQGPGLGGGRPAPVGSVAPVYLQSLDHRLPAQRECRRGSPPQCVLDHKQESLE